MSANANDIDVLNLLTEFQGKYDDIVQLDLDMFRVLKYGQWYFYSVSTGKLVGPVESDNIVDSTVLEGDYLVITRKTKVPLADLK